MATLEDKYPSVCEVFLINPFITSMERYGKDVGEIGGHQMPLGIYYLAAYLMRQGEKVEVIDAEALLLEHANVVDILRKTGVKMVGITATTVAFRNARSLAEMIRLQLPHVVIVIVVIGGPHMTAMAEATMNCRIFDYGIVREGESSFAMLAVFILHRKGNIEDIPNLFYFKGETLCFNSGAGLFRNWILSLSLPVSLPRILLFTNRQSARSENFLLPA